MTSSLAGGPRLETTSPPDPPVWLTYPYSVWHYIAQDGARRKVWRFFALPPYPGRSSVQHNGHPRHTAVGVSRARWKHWRGTGASDFRVASVEMDIHFIRCAEKVKCQKPLAALLAD